MNRRVVFLGWDEPWTRLFAKWLEKEPGRLRRRLVVVPTRESGRRLRESLTGRAARDGIGAILGPRVATPEDFFRADGVMPDAIRWAAWLDVLRRTTDDEVASLFPSGVADKEDAWRLAMVRQIEQARESLISGNADFAAVSRELSGDTARWNELARLEERVISVWKHWGFADPVGAKRLRARNPVRPHGVEEIILAGVTDPAGPAVEAWGRLAEQEIPITILVGAPMDLKEAFDEWGRPRPEFWSDRGRHTTPEPTASLVAADAVALAEALVRACAGHGNRDVAVGVCDSSFTPALERRFEEAGWLAFDPENVPPAGDGLPELLEALAGALDSPDDRAAIARVARHPVVWNEWLKGGDAKATLAALEKWEVLNAVSNTTTAIDRLRAGRHEDENAAGELLAKVHNLVKTASTGGVAVLEKKLREWIQVGGPEAANHAHAEMESWRRMGDGNFGLSVRLKWLSVSLASVSRTPDSPDAVLALQGWLELPFDPSPHLILAGLHEGRVPEAPAAEPLITEAVREKLGLRDRRSRLAREAFLYTAMVEGRRANGSVRVFTAQVDARGEPCHPSRVLLQSPAAGLPARVLNFVKKTPDLPLQPTPPWARANWKLRPPAGSPRE